MEQYTANSNSSTEQIVVQAGQIQQQVWKVITGKLALPRLSYRTDCTSQSFTEPARCFVIPSG